MSRPALTAEPAGAAQGVAAHGVSTGATPLPLALRRADAAVACGVSEETFDKHVRPSLRVVPLGSVRVYPVEDLKAWLRDHAEAPTDELGRLR